MRVLKLSMLMALSVAGQAMCASLPVPALPHVRDFLLYYVAHHAETEVSTFFVCVEPEGARLSATIYAKEERCLLGYVEPAEEAFKPGFPAVFAECLVHGLKLNRDTVDTEGDIGGSTYLVTHRWWIDKMDQCFRSGTRLTISRAEALKKYLPRSNRSEPPAKTTPPRD